MKKKKILKIMKKMKKKKILKIMKKILKFLKKKSYPEKKQGKTLNGSVNF
ncbi:MAG TPA: hypothetical protein PK771_12690 [Spirochaetota bacterium]|nr:hypothetical protein [Spirochaetota bacterium]